MAVSYKNTDIYKTAYKTYKAEVNSAKSLDSATDDNNFASSIVSGASLGASIGGAFGGFGAVFGAGLGIIGGGLFGLFGREESHANKDAALANINKYIAVNTGTALDTQKERNSLISNAQYYVNQSKSAFRQTYGDGTFNMLETTIASLFGTTDQGSVMRMSSILGGLDQDTIIGDIETRLLQQEGIVDTDNPMKKQTFLDELRSTFKEVFSLGTAEEVEGTAVTGEYSQEQINEMLTRYITLEDLGAEYVQTLYDHLIETDTEIGQARAQLEATGSFTLEQNKTNFEQAMLNIGQKFSELFLNERSTNISNAESIGEVEAESGSSGIRASSYARTSVLSTKLKQDIAKASYAILASNYLNQLNSEVKSGKLTREQFGFQMASQKASLKRQYQQSLLSDINSYWHSTVQSVSDIAMKEADVDDAMAAVEAGKQVLLNNGKSSTTTQKYIYSTGSATV